MNDAGRVTGYTSTVGGSNHAFSTGSNGAGMMDLGILGGGESYAHGINDTWQVVGLSTWLKTLSTLS
ncbi:hypothetical protein [Nitrosospira sp. Nsp14]|uniref:hypothetical protein n=1 Tax=Nitrosospira sp. Nsp14 TaxID=1855333 RepID=UPI000B871B37|nr:hypothetical protein [Nitrosospira sp. Nsp14]